MAEHYLTATIGEFFSSTEFDSYEENTSMRDYTLLEVLEAYQTFKRITKKDFSINNSISFVKAVQEEYKVVIMPYKVNSMFYALMTDYLRGKGARPSTITKYFDYIRTALTFAADYGCRLHPTYTNYPKNKYVRDMVALTANEVSHIYYFDISTIKCRADLKKTLERVRDMFCLSCCLGQRYSDMKRLNPDWFDSTGTVMQFRQYKTNNKARVDITKYSVDKKMALEILRKYDYHAPFTGDISNYTKYLKKLIKCIGKEFSKTIKIECKIGAEIVEERYKMWQRISSHTARRTFVSINIMRGYTETEIRRCTAHLTSEAFVRYIVYNDD